MLRRLVSSRLGCRHSANAVFRRHVASGRFVLGIETSFDETGAAVLDMDSGHIVGEALASSYTPKFQHQFSGVIPVLAAAEQEEWLNRIIGAAMAQAGLSFEQLAGVAVTVGPGLAPCLKVGVSRATFISHTFQVPFVPVNHLEAHVLSARLGRHLPFPFLACLLSGGHSQFVVCRGVGEFDFLGGTLDDAVGEAYDKVARDLRLPSVGGGGAALERAALDGDPRAIRFPVAMRGDGTCHLSLSGIKSAARRAIEQHEPASSAHWRNQPAAPTQAEPRTTALKRWLHSSEAELLIASLPTLDNIYGNPSQFQDVRTRTASQHTVVRDDNAPPPPRQLVADIAASFQMSVIQQLEDRLTRAIAWCQTYRPAVGALVLSGGVARNAAISSAFRQCCETHNLELVVPPLSLCTDNGVMIAWAGAEMLRTRHFAALATRDEADAVTFHPRMPLQQHNNCDYGFEAAHNTQRALLEKRYRAAMADNVV